MSKYPSLQEAMHYAVMWHGDQMRDHTGLPYAVHPIQVMQTVAEVTDDEDMLIAAVLHDIVEDTHVLLETIEELFGKRVADLVDWLTDISVESDGDRQVRKAMDREHLASAPPDAQTIKYADVIDNMKSPHEHSESKRSVYLEEKRLLLEELTKGNSELYVRAWSVLYNYEREISK